MNPPKLIVGLGNPGSKYKETRHNIGFRLVEELAKQNAIEFILNKKLETEIAKSKQIILAKPQTFMNNSGIAIQKLMVAYRTPLSSLLVIQDEIDLDFGKIRISKNSSSAGHNGIKSIIQNIGQNFTRLRIGIEGRNSNTEIKTETYVLENFTLEEKKALKNTIIPKALEIIKNALKPTNERKT